MLEVESLDDVMRSYHFLRIHKAPIGMGPGRHPNCQTVHVYVQTPGGFAVEFGWGPAVSTTPRISRSSIPRAVPSMSGRRHSRGEHRTAGFARIPQLGSKTQPFTSHGFLPG